MHSEAYSNIGTQYDSTSDIMTAGEFEVPNLLKIAFKALKKFASYFEN